MLKNIFENEEVNDAMQRNIGMSILRMFVVDETEIQIFLEVFDDLSCHLGESLSTYYIRYLLELLKKQFIFVELHQVCVIPDKDNGQRNAVYSALGR